MTDTVLRLSGVAVGWDGRHVLSDVSLGVNRGDLIAITGPNGGGKTTLMRVVLGLVKPDSGTVEHPSGRLTIGYLPQKNQIDSRFPVTVDEVIAQGLLSTPGLSRSDVSDRLDAMLDLVELSPPRQGYRHSQRRPAPARTARTRSDSAPRDARSRRASELSRQAFRTACL